MCSLNFPRGNDFEQVSHWMGTSGQSFEMCSAVAASLSSVSLQLGQMLNFSLQSEARCMNSCARL